MAKNKYQNGQIVYLVSSSIYVKEAKVLKYANGFYTIKFTDTNGGTRVRESRLFPTKEEAEATAKQNSLRFKKY